MGRGPRAVAWRVIRIDWVDDPTDATISAVASLVNEFWREVIAGEPDRPAAELAAELQHTPAHRTAALAVAVDGDDIVGAAELVLEGFAGREHAGWVRYLVVRPDRRRHGIGRALVETVVGRARQHDRSRLTHALPLCHDSSASFARSVGATPGLHDIQSRLRVADLDREMLERWVARAGDRAPDYSLVAFDGVCPPELLEPVARIVDVMNTAPRSETTEDFHISAEHLRQNMEAFADQGNVMWTVCARHDATGEIVGLTELAFGPHRPWLANQGDTVVHPRHRERGLGRWLKAVNALRMLDERPEVTAVDTWNAGVNEPMLSINRAMGFEPIAEWQEYELTFD